MSPPSISLPGNPCLWEASLRCTACPVGKAVAPLQSGERITVDNVVHYAAEVDLSDAVPYMWKAPDVSRWANRTFDGVIRPTGVWGPRTIGSSSRWCSVRTATL